MMGVVVVVVVIRQPLREVDTRVWVVSFVAGGDVAQEKMSVRVEVDCC